MEGNQKVIVNLHGFNDIDRCPCCHFEDAGQITIFRLDKNKASQPHIVHGPCRSAYIFRDLRLHQDDGDVIEIEPHSGVTICSGIQN